MVKETDLLIIGGGMAGAIAAITAAKSGIHTILVRPGYGATAISSGAINTNGTVEWLRRAQGADKSYDELVEQATASFLDLMAQIGYPYTGSPNTEKQLVNVLGTIKAAQFCPETMAPGNI
jgi:anaerobic glycerol-3-phosphate dehydrogenase